MRHSLGPSGHSTVYRRSKASASIFSEFEAQIGRKISPGILGLLGRCDEQFLDLIQEVITRERSTIGLMQIEAGQVSRELGSQFG